MRPVSSSPRQRARLILATAAALALLPGCHQQDKPGAGPGGKMAPEVGVVAVHPQPVALQTELPARVEPVRLAQVRARVNGVVLKRLFTEGSEVKAGQPLFLIDPAPYQAALESARATLARAEANVTQAQAQAERYKPLVEANAVSQQEYLGVVAAAKQAQADVAAGKAAVRSAEINVGYTRVTAPIAGHIGRALVTEGALVSATEATQLALVQQTASVYLNINEPAGNLLALRKAAGLEVRTGAQSVPVTVVLDDGTVLPRPGKLLFSDLTVDPTTGQVLLRAEVANPDGMLLPGQYVRVRLSQAVLPRGFVVPQQAVARSDKGDSVLVVGADNKPQPRPVTISEQQGSNWVIAAGLKDGEQVVVDGFQKLCMLPPGTPVKPVPWTPAAAPAAAPGAARPGA
jgi:membrane fusion protein (multidrug efflux system)